MCGKRQSRSRAEQDAAEDVGGQLLLSFGLLESLLPVGGSELEDAAAGPAGQQDEQVAEIADGLEPVEPAAGEQGDEDGVGLGPVLAADKEPARRGPWAGCRSATGSLGARRPAQMRQRLDGIFPPNPNLEDISALFESSIFARRSFAVFGNPKLATCELEAFADQLRDVAGQCVRCARTEAERFVYVEDNEDTAVCE